MLKVLPESMFDVGGAWTGVRKKMQRRPGEKSIKSYPVKMRFWLRMTEEYFLPCQYDGLNA
jgi:hypothetical protein